MTLKPLVQIAIPTGIRGKFTYHAPQGVRAGSRVLVPFGRRPAVGIVTNLNAQPIEGIDCKDIEAVLDETPLLSEEMLGLCEWVADYYEVSLGEVIRLALPPGSMAVAKQLVRLVGKPEGVRGGTAGQRRITALLETGPVGRTQLLRAAKAKGADLTALVRDGVVEFFTHVDEDRVKAKKETWAKLAVAPEEVFSQLSRSPAKTNVIRALLDGGGEMLVSELRTIIPSARGHLRELEKRGFVELTEKLRKEKALAGLKADDTSGLALTKEQNDALKQIGTYVEKGGFSSFLLLGATGTGKTEVYLRAIEEVLEKGRTAIVLVPEISLTPQLAGRFRRRFGDQLAVLHSGLTMRQRFDEWRRLKKGDASIALGARSAVFAPLENVGMIVVDEEHDSSFKQEEGVRYNARNVALVRAKRSGGVCVLGSATPSLETRYSAMEGKHQLLRLTERPTGHALPAVNIVDLKTYMPDREDLLAAPLAEAISETLERGEQTILFLNRRGFSTFVVCSSCGVASRCPDCDVSLTYHRGKNVLICHYCDHRQVFSKRCTSCDAETVREYGAGTEKVALALQERFPTARVARLDRDTSKHMERLIGEMRSGDVDILVGTQMVTKGHDFPNVTLVGVLCADTGLSLPDVRASERTFQLLTQVAGRAGRGKLAGRVFVQTFRPNHPAIQFVCRHDAEGFAEQELKAREEHGYPPFGNMAVFRLSGPDASATEKFARKLYGRLRTVVDKQLDHIVLLPPCEAPLPRIRSRYRWQIWLRSNDKRQLRAAVRWGLEEHVPANLRCALDMDPYSFL